MDWNAVGAIGVWAGAIATTGAVIVALKQSNDATSTKVKVGVSLGFIAQGPSGQRKKQRHCWFSSINA